MKKLSKLFLLMILSVNVLADDMGDKQIRNSNRSNHKYKVGQIVMINLKNTKFNGDCDPRGEIWKIAYSKYYLKKIKCKWGNENSWRVKDKDIIDVMTKADFKDDGRFEKGGWFTSDKSEDWLPCKRNDFDEDVQEKLCEKNKLMFY